MAETFKRPLRDLPIVQLPDWELLRRLEELLRPHEDPDQAERRWLFGAEDARSSYSASTVDELESLVAGRELPPDEIQVRLWAMSGGRSKYVRLVMKETYTLGEIASEDEPFADHMKLRIVALFDQARLRREAPEAKRRVETQGRQGDVAARSEPQPGRSRLKRLAYDPWVVGVGGGLLVVGVAALVAWAVT
jgi:hypothetical protein